MSRRQILSAPLFVLLALASCAEGGAADLDAGDMQADAEGDVATDAATFDAAPPDACVGTGEEICNGLDDDCDSEIDEGFGVAEACDSDDADACLDDLTACTADGLDVECVDSGPELLELCNGLDDDCRVESADGSGDPNLGANCDGPDSDLCAEGTLSCAAAMLVCSDNTGSTTDLCNNVDDDCDPSSPDGSEDPGVGVLCDGADGDLCTEGTMLCSGGGISCSDVTTTTVDLCNGTDDDCDPASADGSEDPQIGLSCDGPDGDLCAEGVRVCDLGNLLCTDETSTTIDICNGLDDDCDGSSADGSEDSLVGIACDGSDSDLCNEGLTECVATNVQCSDDSGDTLEVCNGVDDDCDQSTDEGFPRDTDPLCNAAPLLGTVSGDLTSTTLSASEGDERWYRVTISENDFNSFAYLSATIDLASPANMDFDLYVYCESCVGGLAGQSNNGSGLMDTVGIRRNDGPGNEGFDILIEVRYVGASVCSNWSLTVTSDTAVAVESCGL